VEEEELADQILYHKKRYYDGEPVISDVEYDNLEEQLRKLNPNHPVLFVVGTLEGGKVRHDPVMLSCEKATDLDKVVTWANRINGGSIYAGYKVDGLSLSLIYENGNLVQAATRGNGSKGDDVTFAVMKVGEMPKTITHSGRINVRGELYMKITEFNRINDLEGNRHSNPRNLAVGTIKQKDIRKVASRNLSFMAFDLIGMEQSIDENVKLLRSWGFDTADKLLLNDTSAQTIQNVYEEYERERNSMDFEQDGVIFKYNEYVDRINAGETEHHPKWQIAWKYKSKGVTTTINDFTWQVGRTGKITPVAEVEPVQVAGAMLSRATLHNAEFLLELNAAKGDTVELVRSGDVIPRIIRIVNKEGQNAILPETCPSCKSVLTREGVDLMCRSEICKDREIQGILYWLRTVEIDGLGPKSVEKLYDAGKVTHYADLYAVTLEEMVKLLGKNGEKAYVNIDTTRKLEFAKFIAGLGIYGVGTKMGKVLAQHYPSWEALKQATVENLITVEGISDITANSILLGANDPNLGDRVLQNDFEIAYPMIKQKDPSRLKIYVTGRISDFPVKKDVQAYVENLGFEWSKSISGNLHMLVYGEKAGETKLKKAAEKGVKVISWEEFKAFVEKKEDNVAQDKPIPAEELMTTDEFDAKKPDLEDFF
jgi:DNA ligase (NAD+)